jgi:signal transduction histidine kinase
MVSEHQPAMSVTMPDEQRARDARVAAGEDVAVAAAEVLACGAATEMALRAGETAAAMLEAARAAAVTAAHTAKRTAEAAADVAAQNVTEVENEAAVTAAAVVLAATDAAREVAAASHTTARTSATDVALDIADRAAATAEAMVTAATAAATRAADRSRHDADAAADVAAQAIANIVSEAARTAAAMVAAAAAAAPVAASRAAERARHEAHAQGQTDLLSAVVDGITDGIEVVDETGSLLMHNRAATALGVQHGPNTIDKAGEDFGLFLPDGTTPFPHEDMPVTRALAGESSDAVVMLSRNTAHPYGVLLAVSGRPLRDATGRPGAVAVSRDITMEHAQRTELETFAAVAAHDLRTPLAIVTGYLDVITDVAVPELAGATADTVADVLRRARGGADRMNLLIDDLLHYATRDAALVVEDIDLRDRVDEVIAHFTDHLTPGTPAPGIFIGALPWVRGDRARITQVLNNLIGNAMKYTALGQPAHLDITAQPISAASGAHSLVHIQIGDRGIGIPVGQHAAIFTTFHRAHTTSPYGGTGLGLAICHRIIERHGGHIYATDNPGGGTRIHFTLPPAAGTPTLPRHPASTVPRFNAADRQAFSPL